MSPHDIKTQEEGSILFVTDLHWRDIDKASIKGYCKVSEKIADQIERILIEEEVTHMVQLGDWTDKGYRQDAVKFSHTNRLREWGKLLNGNLMMVIGNHFYLERDNNPELYWIQPHHEKPIVKQYYAKEPIIKTPHEFRVGPLQVVLHHYQKVKEHKEYTSTRHADTKYLIGCYHDDYTLPPSILGKYSRYEMTTERMQKIYHNVDYALHGHIHSQLGVSNHKVGDRSVRLEIPGACMLTARNQEVKSNTVKLPLIRVLKTGEIKFKYVEIDLLREQLIFSNTTGTVLPEDDLVPKDLIGTNKAHDFIQRSGANSIIASCEDYLLKSGASQADLEVYREASRGELQLSTVVNNYKTTNPL